MRPQFNIENNDEVFRTGEKIYVPVGLVTAFRNTIVKEGNDEQYGARTRALEKEI